MVAIKLLTGATRPSGPPARRPGLPPREHARGATARAVRWLRAKACALGHRALGFALLLGPQLALAQQPSKPFDLSNILPQSLADQPFLIQIITMLIIVGIAGLFVMMVFGGMSGVADVFTAMSESRQRGEWGSFVKTIGFVAVVFVAAAVVAGTLMGWFADLKINPKVTIG